jgi:hypothetical protein
LKNDHLPRPDVKLFTVLKSFGCQPGRLGVGSYSEALIYFSLACNMNQKAPVSIVHPRFLDRDGCVLVETRPISAGGRLSPVSLGHPVPDASSEDGGETGIRVSPRTYFQFSVFNVEQIARVSVRKNDPCKGLALTLR